MARIADSVVVTPDGRRVRTNALSIAQTGRPGAPGPADVETLALWARGERTPLGPEIERLVHAGLMDRRADPREGVVLSLTAFGAQAVDEFEGDA